MFSFHHVSLNVIDLQKSIMFYQCLGYSKFFLWESENKNLKIAHLKLLDSFLELFCYSNYKITSGISSFLDQDPPTVGIKHFALKVPSIEKARLFLLEKKFSNEINIQNGRTNIKYFFIKDPNEILVEVVEDNRLLG